MDERLSPAVNTTRMSELAGGRPQPQDAETFAGVPATLRAPSTQVDDWLAVEPDGTITVFSGKVELGTGVRTALAQIVAEELDVPLARIRMVMGETDRTPNEGYTAGSKTIQVGGAALRRAAATARQVLLDQAADALGVDRDELIIRDGVITPRGRPADSVSYAALLGGRRFMREVERSAPLKRPEEYRVVGRSEPRLDLLAKGTGQPAFIHDLRLPRMLHARVVRPPSLGAELVSLDADGGVVGDTRVVQIRRFVAVVAEREEEAIRAEQRLAITWRENSTLPARETLFDVLRRGPTSDKTIVCEGDVEQGLADAQTRMRATYTYPFQAHASVGPSCAVAAMEGEVMTVWCSTQGVYPLRGALADLLETPIERVRVVHMEGAGCYGQNGADDAAADAALLAREVGRPVRVQWSRADEFIWEPKSPAMVMETRGGLSTEGDLLAWDYHAWTPTHANRPRQAADLIAGQLIGREATVGSRLFLGGDRNAATNYTLPHQRVTVHWLARSPLRVSSMRSLGATPNTFANESFMDELAAAAGRDPIEFRLGLLDDPRARAVLEVVAREAKWDSPLPAGEGRGVAFARYENTEAYVAAVAEVQVARDTGVTRVRRVTVAHDCGLIINPDGVRNQIEGNVVQGMSRALKEEVRFDAGGITSVDWETYPILTFSEVPEIAITLLNRPDAPAVGVGEPATVTMAPALANAIFAATGARVREAPFTPARVLQALRAEGSQRGGEPRAG